MTNLESNSTGKGACITFEGTGPRVLIPVDYISEYRYFVVIRGYLVAAREVPVLHSDDIKRFPCFLLT